MGKKETNEVKEMKETLESEIKKRNKMPDDVKIERDKKIFRNLLFAIGIIAYFILLNIGFYLIEKTVFTRDTVVFAFATLIITIILFERSYRGEKGYYAIHGLEVLAASVFTYFVPYLYYTFNEPVTKAIMVSPVLFVVYYAIKLAVICAKAKKVKDNDIKDIIKKEETKIDDDWTKMDKDLEAEEDIKEDVKEEVVAPKKETKKPSTVKKQAAAKKTSSAKSTKKPATKTTTKKPAAKKTETKKAASKVTKTTTKKPAKKKVEE